MKSLKNILQESLRIGINDKPEEDIVDFLDKFKWEQSTYNGNSSVAVKNSVYTDNDIFDECINVLKEMNMTTDKNNIVYVYYISLGKYMRLIKLIRTRENNTQDKITIYQETTFKERMNNTYIQYENSQKRENYGTHITLNVISGSVFDELMEKFNFTE